MTQQQGDPVRIERYCHLAGVSRAGYYRHWQASALRQEETALRDALQRLSLAYPREDEVVAVIWTAWRPD